VERVEPSFRGAQGQELRNYLDVHNERGDISEQKLFVHLECVRREGPILPVLSVAYNFTSEVLRLRVGLFFLRNDGSGNQQLCAIGYRFETPESLAHTSESDINGSTMHGTHDYHHAQPITSLLPRGDGRLPDPGARWLPTSQPAFPLEAQDMIQLVACTLVAIYGRQYVMSTDMTEVRSRLGSGIHSLACLKV
jgi:hypothetical protein